MTTTEADVSEEGRELVERLEGHPTHGPYRNDLLTYIASLEAENERLRGLLRKVWSEGVDCYECGPHKYRDDLRRALQALDSEEE